MRLSDEPQYLAAVPAAYNGDFETARINLKALISRARIEGDTLTAGYLLQVLGDVEARANNTEVAHSLHQEALSLDAGNPLPLLLYAKGLLRAFRRPDLALSRLVEVQALIESGRWKPGEDEPNREWYEREISDLRHEITNNGPQLGMQPAR
jgi:predicted Zn-dependent protease